MQAQGLTRAVAHAVLNRLKNSKKISKWFYSGLTVKKLQKKKNHNCVVLAFYCTKDKLSEYNHVFIGSVGNLLACLSDKKRRERYKARIERIRREQGLQELNHAVTREEKDLTVKAMGLTQVQGHWFKCPNGECDFSCI